LVEKRWSRAKDRFKKKHGPCEPVPPPNNVTFFFIYHKDSHEEIQLTEKKYFEEGFKGTSKFAGFYLPAFLYG
jgi:hypothetical protein